jgi:hypothetical protein
VKLFDKYDSQYGNATVNTAKREARLRARQTVKVSSPQLSGSMGHGGAFL